MLSWFRATSTTDFLKTHWVAIVLIVVGTFLRFYHLPEKGILFGDSGHDLLLAAQAVEQRQLPVLGIASSLPRFHQGPLTIWLSMIIYGVVGYAPAWYFWVFAFIGCLAMIALYEFSLVWLNQKIGLFALTLLTFSPLAIAHSRMVYHTVPIAFLTAVVLWFTSQLFERNKNSWPWAVLSTTMLFQHELSLFPVFVALPLAWWFGGLRRGLRWQRAIRIPTRQIMLSGGALVLGLLPQIISEFRDGSQQLSGFILWLGYRVVSFFLPSSDHFAVGTFGQVLERFAHYGSQVFLVPGVWSFGTIALIGLAVLSLVGWVGQISKAHLSAGMLTTLLVTGLITAGYLVHGAPSEAYFPVYVVLLPLLVAIGLGNLSGWLKAVGLFQLALVAFLAVTGISTTNFFVDQTKTWNYGPSVGSQQLVLQWIETRRSNPTEIIGSTDADASFPNYLSSYAWLSQSLSAPIQTTTRAQQAAFLVIHATQTRQTFTNFSGQATLPTQLSLSAVRVMTR